jgi:NADPH2:quinone reductase
LRAVLALRPGGGEVLDYTEIPDPEPGPGEVLVATARAGVNYIDVYAREGRRPAAFPLVLGREGSGTVVEVGEGVTSLAEGDRVAWPAAEGSYAELVVVSAEGLVKLPADVGFEVGAALPLQGITAHYLATDTFPLSPGDNCLIHAAAGGVGLLLTQVAKLRGATVFATAGTDEKVALARDAGADHVVNYRETSFKEAIEGLAGPNAIDVVYDGVGAATFAEGLDLLRPRGTMVTFGNASGAPAAIEPAVLAEKGSLFLTRPTMHNYIATRTELERRMTDLFDWFAGGQLSVRIGAEFPLASAAEAHSALEGRSTTGKVLLVP